MRLITRMLPTAGMLLAALLLTVPPLPARAQAQANSGADAEQAVLFGQEQLDQMLAPVALYPDTLLMQVLAAATYPLEIVAAERFVAANAALKGEALTRAAASKGWDSSIISLLQFPSVLVMMSEKLDWTQQLGDAFLAQQNAVMDAVQGLRAKAQQAGNLQSNTQQTVVVQEKVIVIEPAQPQVIYVPYYNPTVVYGPWYWPNYRPWYWAPPPRYRPYGYGDAMAAGIFWGLAIGISHAIWSDYRPSWHDHHIHVHNDITINVNNRPSRPQLWQHRPEHRKGVAYRDDVVRERVTGTKLPARPLPNSRPDLRPDRGDDPQVRPRPGVMPPAPQLQRPATRPEAKPQPKPAPRPSPTPSARPEYRPETRPLPTREVVKAQADRGRQSRESVAKPSPRPAVRPAPKSAPQGLQKGGPGGHSK
ncbi:DUF3300 domain-containing protein [Roseateles oligotrophus]|uniref:DUF3300 domain-containing protein n=1 Tax=Roseateles oligotrophus TaxID=1769250 RepID=A0ABT2YLX3_9BURK|nr:DUF3300 domain-containing protein [Roseateles oligotrophus]MCV2371066.1 DUF3300 domain-containing protein [Roseateles oligotrophus]